MRSKQPQTQAEWIEENIKYTLRRLGNTIPPEIDPEDFHQQVVLTVLEVSPERPASAAGTTKEKILNRIKMYLKNESAIILQSCDLSEYEDICEEDSNPEDMAMEYALVESLHDILDTLTPRESKALMLYFGFDGVEDRTLDDVSACFNVTRERVRQIIAKAMRKLRHPYRSKKIRDYLYESNIHTPDEQKPRNGDVWLYAVTAEDIKQLEEMKRALAEERLQEVRKELERQKTSTAEVKEDLTDIDISQMRTVIADAYETMVHPYYRDLRLRLEAIQDKLGDIRQFLNRPDYVPRSNFEEKYAAAVSIINECDNLDSMTAYVLGAVEQRAVCEPVEKKMRSAIYGYKNKPTRRVGWLEQQLSDTAHSSIRACYKYPGSCDEYYHKLLNAKNELAVNMCIAATFLSHHELGGEYGAQMVLSLPNPQDYEDLHQVCGAIAFFSEVIRSHVYGCKVNLVGCPVTVTHSNFSELMSRMIELSKIGPNTVQVIIDRYDWEYVQEFFQDAPHCVDRHDATVKRYTNCPHKLEYYIEKVRDISVSFESYWYNMFGSSANSPYRINDRRLASVTKMLKKLYTELNIK